MRTFEWVMVKEQEAIQLRKKIELKIDRWNEEAAFIAGKWIGNFQRLNQTIEDLQICGSKVST